MKDYSKSFYEGELTEEQIREWMLNLYSLNRPHVPQSGFNVIAVHRIRFPGSGRVFYVAGVNVENKDMEVATCGEAGAIAAMITIFGYEAIITEGWILAAPKGEAIKVDVKGRLPIKDNLSTSCGVCRQRAIIYADKQNPVNVHTFALHDKKIKLTVPPVLALPLPFGYDDIQHKFKGKDGIEELTTEGIARRVIRQGILNNSEIFDWLKELALRSDSRASRIGKAAIVYFQGIHVAGAGIDNPAYTASISATRAAMSALVTNFGWQEVTKIWYFECPKQLINAAVVSDIFHMLGGSALQVLSEFSGKDRALVEVNVFNARGEVKTWTLEKLLPFSPTFNRDVENDSHVQKLLGEQPIQITSRL